MRANTLIGRWVCSPEKMVLRCTKMKLPKFEIFRPESLGEAVAAFECHQSALPLAGGTDLLVAMKRRLIRPERLIDLTALNDQLAYIKEDAEMIRIGAVTRLIEIERHPLVIKRLPFLAAAAKSVASIQIRHSATLGGNICLDNRCYYYNYGLASGVELWEPCLKRSGRICHVTGKFDDICYAVYSGDTAPVLISLDSHVTIFGPPGVRTIPLLELFSGVGQTPFNLERGEILKEVEIPLPKNGTHFSFQKFRSQEVDFPLASVAVSVRCGADGVVEEARIVLGALGCAPFRVRSAEDFLKGRRPGEASEAVVKLCRREAQFINNVHVAPTIRRHVLVRLVKTCIAEATSNEQRANRA